MMNLLLVDIGQPGFPFWVSPATPVYIKPSLLTPEFVKFVKFLIPSVYRSPRNPEDPPSRDALNESWNGWFCFSPIGCCPPERLHHVETPMDIDDEADPKIRE